VHKARGDYGTTHANVPILSLNSGGSSYDRKRRKRSDDDESIADVCSPPEAVARALNCLKVESGIDRLKGGISERANPAKTFHYEFRLCFIGHEDPMASND
jgi:hypothetical protein